MIAHQGRQYGIGDVVWTVDPFKHGGDVSRMFATVSTQTHPFQDQQFIGVSITTTDHLIGHPLFDEYWEKGGTPEDSYILPLSIHTPKVSNIQAPPDYENITDPWQGRLDEELMTKVAGEIFSAINFEFKR